MTLAPARQPPIYTTIRAPARPLDPTPSHPTAHCSTTIPSTISPNRTPSLAMSCRALGPNTPPAAPPPATTSAAQPLVAPEQYNALLERLDSEMRTRTRLEAELAAAREQLSLLHRRLNAMCPSNRSVDAAPPPADHHYQPPPATTVVHQRRTSHEQPPSFGAPMHADNKDGAAAPSDAAKAHSQDKEILSHCSDISACKSALRTPDSLKKSTQRKSSTNLASIGGAVKKGTKTKKERTPKVKIPGQSRYWTPEEHKLFLEALNKYGHKDLRSISSYVGTRNMTQVRTHSQKYFMRLMREAKRQNPVAASCKSGSNSADDASSEKEMAVSSSLAPRSGAAENTSVKRESVEQNHSERDSAGISSGKEADTGDKYSVPNTCGMTLLCLVGQDTLPV